MGTWLVASSNSVHLGASGVVFGYATYLVSRGLLSRRVVELAVGALALVRLPQVLERAPGVGALCERRAAVTA